MPPASPWSLLLRRAVTVLLLALLALTSVPLAEAQAAGTASLSGTLTTAAGRPAEDVLVVAYRRGGDGSWTMAADTWTNDGGSYTIGGLAAGTYRLGFDPHDWVDMAEEYWDDAATLQAATDLPLAAGQAVSGLDARLAGAGTVGGTVTGPGGTPVAGVEVALSPDDPELWARSARTTTRTDGTYAFTNVQSGGYQLRFTPVASPHLEASTTLTVVRGTPPPAQDVRLAAGVAVAGRLDTPEGGPVVGATAEVWSPDAATGEWREVSARTTNGDGRYAVGNLTPGTAYRLRFHTEDAGDTARGRFLPEWWDDKGTLEQAADVTAAAGETARRDATLAHSGRVTGRLLDPAGQPVAGADVAVHRLAAGSGAWVEDPALATTTSWDGSFAAWGLRSGTYRLGFSHEAVLATFWQGGRSVGAATDVVVTAGAATDLGEVRTRAAGSVTGTVTDTTGNALAGVQVVTLQQRDGRWQPVGDTTCSGYRDVDPVTTGADGRYAVPDLEPGTYRLRLCHATQAPHTTGDVVVTGGATTTGVDASLAAGGALTGTVVDGDCTTVTALRWSDGVWEPVAYSTVGPGDAFRLGGLDDGTHRVVATEEVGCGEDDDVDWATAYAGEVEVARGATTAVETLTMRPGGSGPQGRVTDGDGAPLRGLVPTLYRLQGGGWTPYLGFGATGDDGHYTTDPVATGTYRLGLVDPAGTLETAFWGGDTVETANDLVVTRGGASQVADIVVLADDRGRITSLTAPRVVGTPAVGRQLTADLGTWSEPGVSTTVQWLLDGVPVAGATGTTYTPSPSQVGRSLSVSVRATKPGWYAASATSAASAAVQKGTLATSGAPTVSGTPRVGSTLTAAPPSYSPTGVALSYQWLVDGASLGGATGATYVVPAALAGRSVSVRVTASAAGYATRSDTSPGTAVALGTLTRTRAPRVTGVTAVGSLLTADPGTYAPAPVTLAYQWLADGQPVAGADERTYVPTPDMHERELAVRVTASAPGYADAVNDSLVTAALPYGTLAATTAPTVTGTARVGARLTATPGSHSLTGVAVAYQWLANGRVLKGATGRTYTVAPGLGGQRVSVRVTARALGHDPVARTSRTTGAVARLAVAASLSGRQGSRGADVLTVTTRQPRTKGAYARFYRRTTRGPRLVGTRRLDAAGRAVHSVRDTATRTASSYYVVVSATAWTNADTSNRVTLR